MVSLPTGTFDVQSLDPSAGIDDDVAAIGDLDVLDDVEIVGTGRDATIVRVTGGDGFDHLHGGTLEIRSLALEGDRSLITHAIETESGGSLEVMDSRIRDWNFAVHESGFPSGSSVLATDTEILESDWAISTTNVDLDRVTVRDIGNTMVFGNYVTAVDSTLDCEMYAPRAILARHFVALEGTTVLNCGEGVSLSNTLPMDLWARNSTFSNNGAAIQLYANAIVRLENVTVAESQQSAVGGDADQLTLYLDHTILAGSAAADCDFSGIGQAIVVSTHSLDSDGSCGLADPTDLPATDPQLLALADRGGPTWTHGLPAGSPARDAGAATCLPTTDQRGELRPQGPACDLGAFEWQPAGGGGPTCGIGPELALLLPALGSLRRRRKLGAPRAVPRR